MSEQPFKRVLVANRGEIAVRIIRACRVLGIESVAAVSDADRHSAAAQLATTTVCIGPAPAQHSYLRSETLVCAAIGSGCDAIHPGYGFLSERSDFAALCARSNVKFIGPSPQAIELMGDKLAAVRLARELAVPCLPASDRIDNLEVARKAAVRIGYPLLLKASAGGGGRGIRLIREEAELAASLNAAAAEAQAAFGDPTLYIEKFISRARHVEIQVIGDEFGTVVHLGERDCSTQRRHQKLIEEAPSPIISPELRDRLTTAALRLAVHVGYRGAGTVEFVYDEETGEIYFLEMNTRIQVEHPVTEMLTGRDLVVEQILVAGGSPLSFQQSDVRYDGHVIECRINAEDPERNFDPAPGRITKWNQPQAEGLRIDTHCQPGYLVPPFYDSLLAKVIVQGRDRANAIQRMIEALGRFEIEGVPTTVPFHLEILRHPDFRAGQVTTRWVEETFLPARAIASRARPTPIERRQPVAAEFAK
jgi:acetyl-CoA carboxylase, biotin carboxylase subunit